MKPDELRQRIEVEEEAYKMYSQLADEKTGLFDSKNTILYKLKGIKSLVGHLVISATNKELVDTYIHYWSDFDMDDISALYQLDMLLYIQADRVYDDFKVMLFKYITEYVKHTDMHDITNEVKEEYSQLDDFLDTINYAEIIPIEAQQLLRFIRNRLQWYLG